MYKGLEPKAKHDIKPIRQLFYCGIGIYTQTPLIMGVQAPSNTGKNHNIEIALEPFPEEDILRYNRSTGKALFHDRGIRIIKNPETGEIELLIPKVKKLVKEIQNLEIEIEDLQLEITTASRKEDKEKIKEWKANIFENLA